MIDDDPAILRTLRSNMTARGYEVRVAELGEDGLREIRDFSPDLLILDLMLPGASGLEVTEEVRRESSVPILVLSARGEERAKVRALDLGADDYLTKPFGMDELLARVRALLRRPGSSKSASDDEQVTIGAVRLEPRTRQAFLAGVAFDLTAREFDLLSFLMKHSGKVLTHRLVLSEVWGPEYSGDTHYLRVFVNRLRRKLEGDPSHPRYILTDVGVGYRFVDPSPADSSI